VLFYVGSNPQRPSSASSQFSQTQFVDVPATVDDKLPWVFEEILPVGAEFYVYDWLGYSGTWRNIP